MIFFLEVISLKEQAGFIYIRVEKNILYNNIVISKFNKIPFKLHEFEAFFNLHSIGITSIHNMSDYVKFMCYKFYFSWILNKNNFTISVFSTLYMQKAFPTTTNFPLIHLPPPLK